MGRTLAPSSVASAIERGQHDAELEQIDVAIKRRKRAMFRPGSRVRLVGLTKFPQYERKIGTVVKVNPTRVTVGIGDNDPVLGYERELLVPVGMLELA